KYCRETLSKTHPQNQHYPDKQLWDNVWFKLRQPALEMVGVMGASINNFEEIEPEDDQTYLGKYNKEGI
ncbi:12288_t:CDS:2, partial [Entrophospora sp. SA101]